MKIEIEKLEFKCIIGILDFERVKKQRISLNLSFDYEFENGSFIDYAELVELVKKHIKQGKFGLLEEALISLKSLLQKTYKINNLKIKLSKLDILKDCVVSVSH